MVMHHKTTGPGDSNMIRVLIDRYLIDGMSDIFSTALRDARMEAVRYPGYISGETLQDSRNPNHFVVISTWVTLHHFEQWQGSDERYKFNQKIAATLSEPEKVTLLEHT